MMALIPLRNELDSKNGVLPGTSETVQSRVEAAARAYKRESVGYQM